MHATRQERTERALFRGSGLTLDDPGYRWMVQTFIDVLVKTDLASGDLTAKALGMRERRAFAAILAREGGVAAGLAEFAFLLRAHGLNVEFKKQDGDVIRPGDTLLEADGEESKLLGLERVGLNLLQRMSGIATTARCLQERLLGKSLPAKIVGTRKTPWGLLDKRALHLGNGGTHRLGLGDAILIKNNHLSLLATREQDAVPIAIEKAWNHRAKSAFIEVEVRAEPAARAAAQAFRRLRENQDVDYPCLLMLDNMPPERVGEILKMLRQENLWDDTLIEASGGISEANVEAYAARGVDAISIGAPTHSARALDLCQRMSQLIEKGDS
jgi:nicotinate-nucleotide pyrophosphorylase (carboxylating)